MNANGWEIAINKEIVENCGTSDCAHKNDYLVEQKSIKEIVELSILFSLIKLNIVLDKTVKTELSFVINKDFEWVLHELLADWSNSLIKGS